MKKLGISRIGHEAKTREVEFRVGSVLVEESGFTIRNNPGPVFLERVAAEVLNRRESGEEGKQRRRCGTILSGSFVVLLLLHREAVSSIGTSSRAEECGKKAAYTREECVKNSGACHVFNSRKNSVAISFAPDTSDLS